MAELTLKERLRKAALTVETTRRSTFATALAAPLKRWTEPSTRKTFGVSEADAQVLAPMAYNQGFYNLFLALGVVGGLLLADLGSNGAASAGVGITKFALASMVLAGCVLLATGRRFRRAALIQALPPALALLASLIR